MGVIDRILTVPGITAAGNAITGVSEVFRENETRRMELDEQAYARAIHQLGQEFAHAPESWFDSFINGLNRLPRPTLTFAVLGLFVYAMVAPAGFATRMQGLALVPAPLWWLLGAIVSFYFGAREAHYFRLRAFDRRRAAQMLETAQALTGDAPSLVVPVAARQAADRSAAGPRNFPQLRAGEDFADNAALRDWLAARR